MIKNCIVVMGVCGSGKTSVGLALAKHFSCRFLDGDDLHTRHNILKMASGQPLNDEDRGPWLERISDVIFSLKRRTECAVIVCSALKKSYRDIIRNGNDNVKFVHLKGSYDLILERMKKRSGHYMKEDMVRSQFDALEDASSEADVKDIDIDCSLDEVIARSIKAVEEFENAK